MRGSAFFILSIRFFSGFFWITYIGLAAIQGLRAGEIALYYHFLPLRGTPDNQHKAECSLAFFKAYLTVKRSFEFGRHFMNLTLMVTGGYLTAVHQCFCSSSKSKASRTQYTPIPVATLRTGRPFPKFARFDEL